MDPPRVGPVPDTSGYLPCGGVVEGKGSALPAIRDRPSVQLTHILDEGADPQHLWTTYVPQAIPVRRPSHGYADISLPCGRCGLPIDLRIYSARATLGLRWSGRIPALVMMAAPVYVLGLTSVMENPTAGSAMVLVGALVVALAGFFWLLLWGFNDGVRLSIDGRKWRVRRRGFHALRLPRR